MGFDPAEFEHQLAGASRRLNYLEAIATDVTLSAKDRTEAVVEISYIRRSVSAFITQNEPLKTNLMALSKNQRLQQLESENARLRSLLEANDIDPDSDPEQLSAANEIIDPSGYTVDELIKLINQVDDVETLDAILVAEGAGKNRTTATDAIVDRIEELESPAE